MFKWSVTRKVTKTQKSAYDKARYAAKRADIRAKQNAYAAEHRKEKRVYDKDYQKRKRKLLTAKRKACRYKNIEHARLVEAAWREKNREKVNAYSKAMLKKRTPEEHRHFNEIARNRSKNATGAHTAKDWQDIIVRQQGVCAACGEDSLLTKDHIVPLSKGGTHNPDNLQGLCKSCNSRKHAKLPHIHVQVVGY